MLPRIWGDDFLNKMRFFAGLYLSHLEGRIEVVPNRAKNDRANILNIILIDHLQFIQYPIRFSYFVNYK